MTGTVAQRVRLTKTTNECRQLSQKFPQSFSLKVTANYSCQRNRWKRTEGNFWWLLLLATLIIFSSPSSSCQRELGLKLPLSLALTLTTRHRTTTPMKQDGKRNKWRWRRTMNKRLVQRERAGITLTVIMREWEKCEECEEEDRRDVTRQNESVREREK